MKNETFGNASGSRSAENSKKQDNSASSYSPLLSGLLREISISRITWAILQIFYCLIGIGAAFVSFLMEMDVFYRITQQAGFSFWIVMILESAKVLTIIVYGFLFRTRASEIGMGTRCIIAFFKFSLITLSLTCSLALVSFYLDRPNIEKVRSDDIQQIEDEYTEKHALMQKRHDTETAVLRAEADREFKETFEVLRNFYEPRIEQLRTEVRKEMNNKVRNDFKGPIYRELTKLLEKTEAEYALKKENLYRQKKMGDAKTDAALADRKKDFRQEENKLMEWRNQEIQKIRTGGYGEDERANNRLVTAVLRTINDGILSLLNMSVHQITFTCLFSFLIAILLEMTIYAAFYSAVLTFSSKLDLMFTLDGSRVDAKKKS